MPIQLLKQIYPEVELGIWKIQETANELLGKLRLSEVEMRYYQSLRKGSRAIQWLSSRVLLRQMIQTDEFIDFRTDAHDKPYLFNFPYHFSISHSHQFAAVIISETCLVGLDIEEIHPKIERIAHKFMSDIEMSYLQNENRILQLYACWSAKEALYKLYGKKGVSFRDHILLNPFSYTSAGQISATLAIGRFFKYFSINYQLVENYMMAWVID